MKFKPEDFIGRVNLRLDDGTNYSGEISEIMSIAVTKKANAKLKEWLDKAPNAFKYIGQKDSHQWEQCQYMAEHLQKEVLTHKGKLVCIEEIK